VKIASRYSAQLDCVRQIRASQVLNALGKIGTADELADSEITAEPNISTSFPIIGGQKLDLLLTHKSEPPRHLAKEYRRNLYTQLR
jgi:hypothetical protein